MEDKLTEFEETKKSHIKLHFGLTCMSYMFFGIGMCFQQFGIKAGFSFITCISVWFCSLAFFAVISFTSMNKVKDILYKKEDAPPKAEKVKGSDTTMIHKN